MAPPEARRAGTDEGRMHADAKQAAVARGALARKFDKFGFPLALVAFAVFLLGLLWSAVIAHLREEREAEIRNAMKNTANLARAFEEHTLRTLREADQVLLFILDRYREQGAKLDLRRLAEDGPISSRIYTYFSIIDERGMLAAGSRPFAPADLSDREHFRVHVGRDTHQLFISKPVVGRASGKSSIQLSRRIAKADRGFGGVAVVSLDPDYFSRFYSQLDLGEQGVVTVFGRADGIVRARRSGADTGIGQDLRNSRIFDQLLSGAHGSYMTASAIDGTMRIVSYRTLAEYPLVVAVGVARDEALASFNEHGRAELMAAALASVLILGFAAYLLVLAARRQDAETALRQRNTELAGAVEHNAQLAAIVESSNDAIFSRTPEGVILSWNAGAEQIFGYAAAEALGRNITIIAPPLRQHEPVHDTWVLQQGKALPPFETVCVAKDGREVPVQASVSAIRDGAGRLTRVAAIFRDITERKRMERELRESESRFRCLTELSSDWYWEQDANFRFTVISAGALHKGKVAAEAALGKTQWELPNEIDERAWAAHRATLEAHRAFTDFEYKIIAADGSLRYFSVRGEPIFDIQGCFKGYRGTANDITGRMRAQQAIERERDFIAAALDSLPGLFYLIDDQGWFLRWNRNFEIVSGYAHDELSRLNCMNLFAGADKDLVAGGIRQALATGEATVEVDLVTKGQARIPYFFSGRLIDIEHKPCVIGMGIDVTGRKRAERELRQIRMAMDLSPDSIYLTDPASMCFVYINDTACRRLGRPREQLLQLGPQDVLAMGREEVRRDFEAVIAAGERGLRHERPYIRHDGRQGYTELHRCALRADGATTVVTIGRDITERRRAEDVRARLAAIVADSSDAIISRTLEGTITSWNAAAERLLGYSAAEAIGQPIDIVMPFGHEAQVDKHSRLLLAGGRIPPEEVMRRTKDGRLITVLRSVSPIRSGAGELTGASIIIRDVSVLKQAERDLKHKAALTELMESLARAANEAATPEEALRACLARICEHGNWLLGRVGTFALGRPKTTARTSIWHGQRDARFEAFISLSDSFDNSAPSGRFLHAAVREQRPVWISDFSSVTGFRRAAPAAQAGIRSGFVFPVIVGNEVAAFLEFFAAEVRETDALFLAAIGGIGSQLARVIERRHALDQARANEQKLDSILGALQEVVWSMDPQSGRLLYLNATARKLTRRPVNDLLADARLWRRMVHPDDRAAVRDGVRKLMAEGRLTHEFRLVLADGEVRTVENRAQVVRDGEGRPQRIDGTIADISERKKAEELIDHLAQHDAMTGLPNRRLFNDRLTLALARDKRLGAMTAVLLLDLDRFKQINESLGHGAGDQVLQAVTARLKERLREADTVARLGGDEFAVILEGVTGNGQAFFVAEKLLEMMVEPITLEGEEVFVTASVGVAVCPADGDNVETLIEHAELAMYQAKDEGRNTAQVYVAVEGRRQAGRGMESKLRRAIERDELLLHYQPKVDIRSGAIVGAEALVRWRNPELGLVSPADFIPLAEETGLIVPIGEWVLHSACMQAKAWQRQGYLIGMAVNLSARQFRLRNLSEIVTDALADCALDAGSLELEITESMVMHRPEQTIATLQRLHDIGVKLSVDDFGTGYSSLSYLKRFPVHTLKVDQSFVRDLHRNPDDAAIVRAVIALANSLNLNTVAEGVETEQQLIYLAGLSCDQYQGFYFSKPLPAAEFLLLLRETADLAPA